MIRHLAHPVAHRRNHLLLSRILLHAHQALAQAPVLVIRRSQAPRRPLVRRLSLVVLRAFQAQAVRHAALLAPQALVTRHFRPHAPHLHSALRAVQAALARRPLIRVLLALQVAPALRVRVRAVILPFHLRVPLAPAAPPQALVHRCHSQAVRPVALAIRHLAQAVPAHSALALRAIQVAVVLHFQAPVALHSARRVAVARSPRPRPHRSQAVVLLSLQAHLAQALLVAVRPPSQALRPAQALLAPAALRSHPVPLAQALSLRVLSLRVVHLHSVHSHHRVQVHLALAHLPVLSQVAVLQAQVFPAVPSQAAHLRSLAQAQNQAHLRPQVHHQVRALMRCKVSLLCRMAMLALAGLHLEVERLIGIG